MNDLSATLMPALLRTGIILTISAVIVSLSLRMLNVVSPTIRRCAYFAVLLQGCFLVQLPLTIALFQAPAALLIEPSESQRRIQNATTSVSSSSTSEGSRLAGPIFDSGSDALPTVNIPTAGQRDYPWTRYLAMLWVAGIAGLLCRSMWSYVRFIHRGLPPARHVERDWTAEWETVQKRGGVHRLIPLHATEHMGPMLCRFPSGYRLILPVTLWKKLSAVQRLSILRHELAHVERYDVWKSLGIRILAMPHWFNPLVWWVVKQFDQCAEWACDEAARKAAPERVSDYADALLQLGNSSKRRLLVSLLARDHGLAFRIRRLLTSTRWEDSRMKKISIAVLVVGISLLSVLELQLVAEERSRDPEVDGSLVGGTGISESEFQIGFRNVDVQFTDNEASGSENNQAARQLSTKPDHVVLEHPGREAIVDVRYLLKNMDEFERERDKLKALVIKADAAVGERKVEIRTLSDRLEELNPAGDRLFVRLLKKEIAEKKAELESKRRTAQREFLRRESEIYLRTYDRVVTEVASYAKEHGIYIVRPANRDPSAQHDREAPATEVGVRNAPSPGSTPHEILKRMFEDVLYVDRGEPSKLDITQEILNRLNSKASETESGDERE